MILARHDRAKPSHVDGDAIIDVGETCCWSMCPTFDCEVNIFAI